MRRTRAGFTIVELLVVIGVVSVLLALGGGAAVSVARAARMQMSRVSSGSRSVTSSKVQTRPWMVPPEPLCASTRAKRWRIWPSWRLKLICSSA